MDCYDDRDGASDLGSRLEARLDRESQRKSLICQWNSTALATSLTPLGQVSSSPIQRAARNASTNNDERGNTNGLTQVTPPSANPS